MDNEQTNHQQISTPEQNQFEKDKPEIRDEISTLTFEYEIAYYTTDYTPIYQFKMKEKSQHNYSPISYTMDYVCCENETCPKTQYNKQNNNKM